MLTGISFKQIDAKGRLSIPKRMRDILLTGHNTEIIVLKMDHCLQVYPLANWAKIQADLENLSPFKEKSRLLQRLWGLSTELIDIDQEGRVILSSELKRYAGIDSEVVVVGAMTKIEIWSSEKWLSVMEKAPSLEEMADDIGISDP